MHRQNENPAVSETAGLGNVAHDQAINTRDIASPQASFNGPSKIDLAKCDLLRDFVVESLSLAAHYADTAMTFASIGDDALLEQSMRGYTQFARAAAKAAREVVNIRKGSRP